VATGLVARGLIALLLSVFVVSLAYGIALPLLPSAIERAVGAGGAVELQTGLISGSYAFALFLLAPLWGRWSDNGRRRAVLLIGLCGFVLALAAGAAVQGMVGLYLSRFLSGAFAACIVPLALALVVDAVPEQGARARYFAWVGIASIAGLLGGPLIGGALDSRIGPDLDPYALSQGGLALVTAAVAAIAVRWLPPWAPPAGQASAVPTQRRDLTVLLGVSGLVAVGLGAFEVGVTLRARYDLQLTSSQLGLIFAECMLAMGAAQLLIFNRWVKVDRTARLIAPSLFALGLGLILLNWASSPAGLMFGTGAIAAASGILLPVLGFWTSLAAGPMQGRQLGWLSSISSLGQAIGSALAGLFAGNPGQANWGILAAGAASVVTALVLLGALRRISRLATPTRAGRPSPADAREPTP
jgi:MFS family permease